MKPTELLEREHVLISTMLRVLKSACQRLEAGERVDGKHLEQMLEFITTFADRCHHGKEETLLFPALEEVGLPKEGGPIGLMLREHDLGRQYIAALREAVAEYQAGKAEAVAAIIKNAGLYVALLTQHIDKENHILFKIAEIHLSPETQDELVRAFLEVDEEMLGDEKRAGFLEQLDRLSELYLGETSKHILQV